MTKKQYEKLSQGMQKTKLCALKIDAVEPDQTTELDAQFVQKCLYAGWAKKGQRIQDNFDEANIEEVMAEIERKSKSGETQAYTMTVEHSGPTQVKLNKNSYKKCTDLLFD